jgi:hypothetical protein
MSSQINTNGIDTNYPVPGQNNSSQGFRSNFSQIKNNINIASEEITDLQNKVLLKAALNDSVLNNDMANTLISNASTKGFRSTTYNLGNALAGTVIVDVNKADVHYGTITGNVTLQFGNWAPTNTESTVSLRLAIANSDAVISLPNQVVSSNNNFGTTLIENYVKVGNTATITAPNNTDILEYTFTTLDCGNTITIAPTNRPYQSTQIISRDPPPTGQPGDVKGAVAIGTDYFYVCTDTFDSTIYNKVVVNTFSSGNIIQLNNTTDLSADIPIIFTGNVDTANTNLVSNQVYYVKTIASPNITISSTRVAGTAGSEFDIGTKANANIAAQAYVGTDIWKKISLTSW